MKKPKYAVSLQAIAYPEALHKSWLPSTSISFISYSSATFSGIASLTSWSPFQ